jgi:hypothetical protein
MGLLELLKQLFGKNYLNNIIGTGTNVSKPIKLDKNSPFKLYSDKAFNDPEVLVFIEKKLAEYGPYALSNKNMSEVKNFEMNARRALNAKQPKKESTVKSVVESMFGPLGKSEKPTPKPEAEVVDIRTKEKVKPEGIMKLKTELGLPEGVEPGSIADKAIKESVEYKTKQQGVKSVLDEDYVPPKSTLLDEDEIADIGARGYSAAVEGKRRAVIRQILLKDARIDLPEDIKNSLKNYDDLRGGADENMDPLKIFDKYYERDNEILGELDGIIDTAENEFKAADTFLSMEDNFKPKDLGTKLKDYDGDPDGLADGGRPGFAGGGIKFLKEMINKKFGKDTIKTADKIDQPDSAKFKKEFEAFEERNRLLTDEEYEDFVEEIGDNIEAYDMPQTIADRDKILKDIADYKAEMFQQYKMGKLDPKPGEPGRKEFLERKLEEAELSGDSRLITSDERDELMMLQTEELAPQMTERMQLKIRYPGITDDLIKKIMIDDNPQRKAEVLATLDEAFKMMDKGMSSDEILNTVKNTPRTKNAGGGLNYLMGL